MNAAQFNALIRKARLNDKRAVEILYKYCLHIISMHLSARFRYREELHDWAHDVFVYRFLSNLPKSYVGNPSAWLSKIADNYVLTMLKREKRTVELPEVELSAGGPADGHLERIVNKLMLEEELKGIDELTIRIFVLNSHFGYTFDEIGKMLGILPATARKRASRTRLKKQSEKETQKV